MREFYIDVDRLVRSLLGSVHWLGILMCDGEPSLAPRPSRLRAKAFFGAGFGRGPPGRNFGVLAQDKAAGPSGGQAEGEGDH